MGNDERKRRRQKKRNLEWVERSVNVHEETPAKKMRFKLDRNMPTSLGENDNLPSALTDVNIEETSKRPSSGDIDPTRKIIKNVSSSKWKVAPPPGTRLFAGKRDVLSNFYPCKLNVYGTTFESVEHAYQWRKSMSMNNQEAAAKIKNATDAGQAKRLAKQYFVHKNLNEWIPRRIPAMKQLIRAKARCCPEYTDELIRTGDSLIAEAVPYEMYWGIGDGTGKNVMGKLHMELRSHLTEALTADPEKDGQLIEFPIQVISAVELKGIDWKRYIPGINIHEEIVRSIGEAHYCIQKHNTSYYMATVLNLLSRTQLSSPICEVVEAMKNLVDEIAEKRSFCKIITLLPIYPTRSSHETYNKHVNDVNGHLERELQKKSNVVCQPIGLHLKLSECFRRKDDLLTDRAKIQLGQKLNHVIKKCLFNMK